MKNAIQLSLYLVAFSIALPWVQGFTCPLDSYSSKCLCLYLNPVNCNTFWQCTPDGRAFLKQCPGNLEWNDFIKVCDWPSDQTCKPGLQPIAKPTPIISTTVRPITRRARSPITKLTTLPTTSPSPLTTSRLTTMLSTAPPTTTIFSTIPSTLTSSTTTKESASPVLTNGPNTSIIILLPDSPQTQNSEEPTDIPTEELIDTSTRGSTDQTSIENTTEKPTTQEPISSSTESPTEETSSQPSEPTDVPTDRPSTQKPIDSSSAQTSEEPTDISTDKPLTQELIDSSSDSNTYPILSNTLKIIESTIILFYGRLLF